EDPRPGGEDPHAGGEDPQPGEKKPRSGGKDPRAGGKASRPGEGDDAAPGRAPGNEGRPGGEATHGPDLEEEERAQAEERTSIGAHIVHEAIRREGEEELMRPPAALAFSGLAGGLSMGFSLVAEGLLRSHLPDTNWRPLVARAGYSLGFLIVILGRQQLFTENTLTAVLPLLARRDRRTLIAMLRLWGIVLATNLLGALAMSWVLHSTGVFEAPVKAEFLALGREAMGHDFPTTVLRGVFAGWLIALIVWLTPAAKENKIWVILILTYIVGLAGLAHIIAGAVEVFYAAWAGAHGWGQVLGSFLTPTLIGNIIGGGMLVAALNYAQVTAGQESSE
ncbi:MAG TPA: formate/nitrite transporter family protein, partial [Deinococcales bacterium]|nr:formate/nitrite transporter family protein [Deinococcales bacterium]